mmetsp:Transcript_137454/g.439123  ORF Transcript_137454/g.439123 Transcript_137454/m.439123 type:complete len:229 (-) Transcript_137454:502-1188(-)
MSAPRSTSTAPTPPGVVSPDQRSATGAMSNSEAKAARKRSLLPSSAVAVSVMSEPEFTSKRIDSHARSACLSVSSPPLPRICEWSGTKRPPVDTPGAKKGPGSRGPTVKEAMAPPSPAAAILTHRIRRLPTAEPPAGRSVCRTSMTSGLLRALRDFAGWPLHIALAKLRFDEEAERSKPASSMWMSTSTWPLTGTNETRKSSRSSACRTKRSDFGAISPPPSSGQIAG